ncbi:uncharacterized protein FIBRA_04468 [Fibroporia radiculosa]|uniref:DUF4211 domain-containing protein n=1 Tax=Fibroporia radiculosa TaxID=599839 RepID=J4G7F2_9APHY|nr:uncharacterized protein FIBRA_04468 [Fibroporia radiculosa]CCM02373.1 predicted protein [Fibroporia radiculosa]
MPRKRIVAGNATQRTLDGFLRSSSPIELQTNPHESIRKPRKRQSRKTVSDYNSSSAHILANNDDLSQSSDTGAIHFEQQVTEISSDEDSQKQSPRRPVSKKRKVTARRADSDDEDVAPVASEEEVKGIPVVWKARKTGVKRSQVVVSDSSEEQGSKHRRRKFVKGIRPPSPEENLLNEVDEDKIIEPRLRQRDKKSVFQRNLEKLKRRKRGEVVESPSSSSNEKSDDPVPFRHAKRDRSAESSDQSGAEANADDGGEDEDNFIVEDDSTEAPALPVEFSMSTHQDLVHHFKTICQLFVHVAVHPKKDHAFVMEELLEQQYFIVPLSVTRRKISGMRDSLVTSSTWRPEFKKSLDTYPDFETFRLDFATPSCDACHLGGRMSTILGRLGGRPYDRDSFEHSLFKALLLEIDSLRDGNANGFVRVAYAGSMKPPEDLSDADAIMEWLDSRGVINFEWLKIKEMMESARNLESRARKGEDDLSD